jgi:hypothetical protein
MAAKNRDDEGDDTGEVADQGQKGSGNLHDV